MNLDRQFRLWVMDHFQFDNRTSGTSYRNETRERGEAAFRNMLRDYQNDQRPTGVVLRAGDFGLPGGYFDGSVDYRNGAPLCLTRSLESC
jgi:hypothetical protein